MSGRHRPVENSLLTKHVVAAGNFAKDAGSTPAASTIVSSLLAGPDSSTMLANETTVPMRPANIERKHSRSANSTMSSQGRLTRVALGFGITVRLLYFGSQVAAALVFPGYSFLSQSASQLGSDLARYPAVFNIGAIATGLATLLASWGFLRGLTGVGRPRVSPGLRRRRSRCRLLCTFGPVCFRCRIRGTARTRSRLPPWPFPS